jgi:hypothetical protein
MAICKPYTGAEKNLPLNQQAEEKAGNGLKGRFQGLQGSNLLKTHQ